MLRYIIAIGALAVSASSVSAQSQKYTVLFGQRAVGATESIAYHTPKQMGFFAKEGLDVTLQPTEGGSQLFQILDQGLAQSGVASIPGILLARQEGVKAKAIFLSIRRHGTSIAVLADGPIKEPKDLKGKKIGVVSPNAYRTLDGHAMAKAAGLDPAKDVQWLPVGFGPQAALALARGDVQALALWDSGYVDIENQGVKMRYFTFPFQKDLMGYLGIASETALTKDRDRLVKYYRAYTKSVYLRDLNPRIPACAFLIETKQIGAPDAKKIFNDALNMLNKDRENAALEAGATQYGAFPSNAWDVNRDYYVDLGVVKTKLPATDYYLDDPAWYAAINNFDRAEVEALAKSYDKCRDF